jgi:transcriptional regulator with XRE-family HTH domain
MRNIDYLIESGDYRIGQILKRERQEKKLSALELSKLLCCSKNNIYLIESGKSVPSIKLFLDFCRVLKIDEKKLVITLLREYQECVNG